MATRLTNCDAPVLTGLSGALREQASGPKHMALAKARLRKAMPWREPPKQRPPLWRRILRRLGIR